MKSKSFESFTLILSYLIKYFKLVVFAAVLLGVLSGIYRVESSEVAIVLRFGRIVGDLQSEQVKQPGIHFALPFFIDEVIKVPVQMVHEREIVTHFTAGNESVRPPETIGSAAGESSGGSLLDLSSSLDGGTAPDEGNQFDEGYSPPDPLNNPPTGDGYLLTGDRNIVLIKATVKYQISNAVNYALYSSNAENVIDGIVSSELTRLVTHMDVDSVLTSGKAQMVSEVTAHSQNVLDNLQTGVSITNIEFTDTVPPAPTKLAFEQVISASVDKETMIQAARQGASTLTLEAEAEAKNYTQNALSYQSLRLTRAHNEMAEFNGLFDQYTQDPQIIINGTFRQRVGAVLKQMGGSVIIPEGDSAPTIILPYREGTL